MTEALRGFHGLEHVMEPAGEIGGVRFVNDSKATNVEAARRSIESFDGGVVAIVGGRFKGGDLRELREPLAARGRAVVAIGEAAPLVREALTGVVPVVEARVDARGGRARVRGGGAGRRRAAGAGVRELRLVPRLRGARTGVQGRGASRLNGRANACAEAVSSRQSVRRGWEPTAGNADYPGLRGGCPFPRAG